MDMVTPTGRPDQLLGVLRDKLGQAAVLTGCDVPALFMDALEAALARPVAQRN